MSEEDDSDCFHPLAPPALSCSVEDLEACSGEELLLCEQAVAQYLLACKRARDWWRKRPEKNVDSDSWFAQRISSANIRLQTLRRLRGTRLVEMSATMKCNN